MINRKSKFKKHKLYRDYKFYKGDAITVEKKIKSFLGCIDVCSMLGVSYKEELYKIEYTVVSNGFRCVSAVRSDIMKYYYAENEIINKDKVIRVKPKTLFSKIMWGLRLNKI